MRIRDFAETDTALIELGGEAVAEAREVSEDLLRYLGDNRRGVSITLEHASTNGGMDEILFQRIGASGRVQATL